MALERQSAGNRRFREVMQLGDVAHRRADGDVIEVDGPAPIVKTLSQTSCPSRPRTWGGSSAGWRPRAFMAPPRWPSISIAEVALAIVAFMVPLYFMGWRKGMLFAVTGRHRRLHDPVVHVSYYVAKRKKQIEQRTSRRARPADRLPGSRARPRPGDSRSAPRS